MEAEIRAETARLIQRGTFRLVILPEQHRENVVPSRFVLACKHATTGEAKYKARFVVGGHRDIEKHCMVHTANTLSHTSVRLLVAVASIFGLDIWAEDVRQTYL